MRMHTTHTHAHARNNHIYIYIYIYIIYIFFLFCLRPLFGALTAVQMIVLLKAIHLLLPFGAFGGRGTLSPALPRLMVHTETHSALFREKLFAVATSHALANLEFRKQIIIYCMVERPAPEGCLRTLLDCLRLQPGAVFDSVWWVLSNNTATLALMLICDLLRHQHVATELQKHPLCEAVLKIAEAGDRLPLVLQAVYVVLALLPGLGAKSPLTIERSIAIFERLLTWRKHEAIFDDDEEDDALFARRRSSPSSDSPPPQVTAELAASSISAAAGTATGVAAAAAAAAAAASIVADSTGSSTRTRASKVPAVAANDANTASPLGQHGNNVHDDAAASPARSKSNASKPEGDAGAGAGAGAGRGVTGAVTNTAAVATAAGSRLSSGRFRSNAAAGPAAAAADVGAESVGTATTDEKAWESVGGGKREAKKTTFSPAVLPDVQSALFLAIYAAAPLQLLEWARQLPKSKSVLRASVQAYFSTVQLHPSLFGCAESNSTAALSLPEMLLLPSRSIAGAAMGKSDESGKANGGAKNLKVDGEEDVSKPNGGVNTPDLPDTAAPPAAAAAAAASSKLAASALAISNLLGKGDLENRDMGESVLLRRAAAARPLPSSTTATATITPALAVHAEVPAAGAHTKEYAEEMTKLLTSLQEAVAELKAGGTPSNHSELLSELFLLRTQIVYEQYMRHRLQQRLWSVQQHHQPQMASADGLTAAQLSRHRRARSSSGDQGSTFAVSPTPSSQPTVLSSSITATTTQQQQQQQQQQRRTSPTAYDAVLQQELEQARLENDALMQRVREQGVSLTPLRDEVTTLRAEIETCKATILELQSQEVQLKVGRAEQAALEGKIRELTEQLLEWEQMEPARAHVAKSLKQARMWIQTMDSQIESLEEDLAASLSTSAEKGIELSAADVKVVQLETQVQGLQDAMEKQAELLELSQMTAAAQIRSVESKYSTTKRINLALEAKLRARSEELEQLRIAVAAATAAAAAAAELDSASPDSEGADGSSTDGSSRRASEAGSSSSVGTKESVKRELPAAEVWAAASGAGAAQMEVLAGN